MPGTGRKIPKDFKHVERYPLRAVQPDTVATVERRIYTPSADWRRFYDQGNEGACVGYGSSQAMSILNGRRYNPRWLWDRAKERDDWPETNPGDNNGTSVRAAMDVLRDLGHVRVRGKKEYPVSQAEGIAANRWATTVDEMRTCIANGIPVVGGFSWYPQFSNPIKRGREWWIDPNALLTMTNDGHCICFIAASDERQAFLFPNSWGLIYPPTWMPYETLNKRLLPEYGEATVITDR